MPNKTTQFIKEFETAYMAHITPPKPTLDAILIAKYPDKMRATRKSALTVIQYRCKGVSYRVW